VIGKSSNSLQNLILHRKACNHPCLVEGLAEDLPPVQPGFQHSAKLIGLIEILQNCEIIVGAEEDRTLFATETKQPHRALVFCQMQSFMHIVESDVLQLHNIKYLTLTGAMTAKQRLETVD
jgi:SNF2 family DNA or RNA helicase